MLRSLQNLAPFRRPLFVGGGGSITISVEGSDSVGNITANPATTTFSSVGIGTADAGRLVAVAIMNRRGTYSTVPSTVTIGGISATLLHSKDTTVSSFHFGASIWIASVPSGTTADVVVTWSDADVLYCNVLCYRLLGAASTAYDTADHDHTSGTTIDVAAGGIIIGGMTDGNAGPSCTPTGLTEDYDVETDANADTAAAGHHESASGETGRAVRLQSSTTFTGAAFVSISPT